MPMGCGEQNMILFTPNIYVINYLEATKQLEESIKDEALDHMKQGSFLIQFIDFIHQLLCSCITDNLKNIACFGQLSHRS